MAYRLNWNRSHEADVYADLRQTLMDDALCAAVAAARAAAEEAAYVAWLDEVTDRAMMVFNFDAVASVWSDYVRLSAGGSLTNADLLTVDCIRLHRRNLLVSGP